jgi:YggT family protein
MGYTIFRAVNVAFEVYSALLLIRILLSWIRHNPYQPIIRFIYEVTDPYLRIFRRIVPPYGQIDFSPIVAFFVLEFIIKRIVLVLLGLII